MRIGEKYKCKDFNVDTKKDNDTLTVEKAMEKHVAISSLESPEHAVRKDPKIISISWMLGKRCNYDCSYCGEPWHDNYSPHIPKENFFNFIDQLEEHVLLKNKKFKINITGGEPFVHPEFMDILKYVKSKDTLTQLVVCTNGSLPLGVYQESARYVTNLTISLHLEQNEKVIQDTVDKVIELNKIDGLFLNVNLMCLPGKFDFIKDVMQRFKENSVKYVLRKIIPLPAEPIKIDKKDHAKILEKEKNFDENKRIFQEQNQNELEKRQSKYYSENELDFFEQNQNAKQWKNIRIHMDDHFIEKNTDELQAKNLNSWKGWDCYVGIDALYVQHNGTVFRGDCLAGNEIGKLGSKIDWPSEPLTCPLRWCHCNAVMPVRKYKQMKYRNLVND